MWGAAPTHTGARNGECICGKQKGAFEQQVNLAKEPKLRIIIHDREAHDDLLQSLRSYGKRVIGVMHFFSGSLEMVKDAIELGYLISLAGPVTFRNARKLLELVRQLPEESMLLETDCPLLAPQSMLGKRNKTVFLDETGRKVAELKVIEFRESVERDITLSFTQCKANIRNPLSARNQKREVIYLKGGSPTTGSSS